MKINYRLEISYHIFPKNGKPYEKIDNYLFQSENSLENRKDALNKLESFEHIFELSNKSTKNLKLSILDIYDNDEIENFTIPSINLFYSNENFSNKNEGILLYGSLLDTFEERIEELVDERKYYEKEEIENFETERIIDTDGNEYIVLKNSPIKNIDLDKII